jgi:hypothetical protein
MPQKERNEFMNKETKALLSEINAITDKKSAGNSQNDNELEALRYEKRLRENLSAELEEFKLLFPDADIEDVPDEVWEAAPDGKGLCAQYALYLKRLSLKKESAEKKNEENGAAAVPEVGGSDKEIYFTPEAVEKMSRAEVEKNWTAILESMKKWK